MPDQTFTPMPFFDYGPWPAADLDSVPTMRLVREVLDRGAERVLRYFGMSVEQLFALARELGGGPGSRAFAADLRAAAEWEPLAD